MANKQGGIYYGWVVLACVSVVLLLTYGVQYSFGVFFTTMLRELGWSRASLAGAFSLYSLVYITLSLYTGYLVDRIGPRWVISLGGFFLGIGMILVSWIQAPWQLYLFYGCLAGIGMSTAYVPCTATAVKWFKRRRGLAVSVTGCGASLGIIVFPPLSEALITGFGWRETYLVFGVAILILLNVLAVFVVREPEALGLKPDGDNHQGSTADSESLWTDDRNSWQPREAVRTGAFWVLASVMLLSVFTIPSVFVHLPQHAADLQIQGPRSFFLTLVGLGALIGNLTLGRLSDLVGRRVALLIAVIVGTLALGSLSVATGTSMLYGGSICFGFYYGAFASLFPALMGDFFGRQSAGTLTGLSFAMGSVTSAVGPIVTGWVADKTSQYSLAFLLGACVNGLVVILLAFARPPLVGSQQLERASQSK
jgi:OFA family oxalate/formate antiporter-like MFS transporter